MTGRRTCRVLLAAAHATAIIGGLLAVAAAQAWLTTTLGLSAIVAAFLGFVVLGLCLAAWCGWRIVAARRSLRAEARERQQRTGEIIQVGPGTYAGRARAARSHRRAGGGHRA